MESVSGMEKAVRARNWTTIIYPSECKEDFKIILESLCVPACLSPLHTPAEKKEHYHLLLSGDKKTLEQIKREVLLPLSEWEEEGKSIKGIANPQRVVNLRSTVRYFLHLDNPNKQQFEKKELVGFGGFDWEKYLKSEGDKKNDKYSGIKGIIEIIKREHIGSILSLLDYCGKYDNDLFLCACDCAYLCTQIIKSFNESENGSLDKIVKDSLK